jgi:hypothetical protein
MSALPVSLRQAGSCVLPYHRAGMPITGRDQCVRTIMCSSI